MPPQTLYRKWRPQTFAEVVGQGHAARTLLNALQSGRLAHAYLFCGPRGTGKTSAARVLAKAVNCQTNQGRGEPCNGCPMCEAITQGRALDIIEIDAASNRGIDEMRDLRQKVNFAPSEARIKFYIIDEAHQLTSFAFDALLKTLEEPPPHAVFVLASTAPHQIPLTILSRCQRFDFRPIALKDMLARLHHICAAEGINTEPGALEAIARAAAGSLRDAVSLLDQLRAYGEDGIALEHVRALLGASDRGAAEALVQNILHRDAAAGLQLIHQVASDGADLRRFTRDVVEYLRGLLLLRVGGERGEALWATVEERATMQRLAQAATPDELVRWIRLFSQTDFPSHALGPPQLFLELALVEAVGQEARPVRPSVTGASEAPPSSQGLPLASPATPFQRPAGPPPERPQDLTSAPREVRPPPSEGLAPPDLERLVREWKTVLESFGPNNKTIQALLRASCEPIAVDNGTVLLGFYYNFHKERIEDPKNRAVVEEVVSRVVGYPCRIRCTLTAREKRNRPSPAIEDPLVKAALSQFGGRIKGLMKPPPPQDP